MTTAQRLIALLLIAAAITFGAPNFIVDGVSLDSNDPAIGTPIDRIVGSEWLVSFEDLYLPLSDHDWNDYALWVWITEAKVHTLHIAGLSAHKHKHKVFDDGTNVVIELTDKNAGFQSYTGTNQAWVQCVIGCSAPPTTSPVPEPATYLLAGGSLLIVVWARFRLRRYVS
jgi:hypothetical protein